MGNFPETYLISYETQNTRITFLFLGRVLEHRAAASAEATAGGGRATHLMVPVGEGTGLTRLRRSGSGMWIFSGEICG